MGKAFVVSLLLIKFSPSVFCQILSINSSSKFQYSSIRFSDYKSSTSTEFCSLKHTYRLVGNDLLREDNTRVASYDIDSSQAIRSASYDIRSDLICGLKASQINCDELSVAGDSVSLHLNSDTTRSLTVSPKGVGIKVHADIYNSSISKLTFIAEEFITDPGSPSDALTLINSRVDSLFLYKTHMDGNFDCYGTVLPNFILINELSFAKPETNFDLTRFKTSGRQKVCYLSLNNVSDIISRVKLNYENFQLIFDNSTEPWEKERIYKQLLEEQQKDGFTFGLQKLDKEYKKFKYTRDGSIIGSFQNWLDATWWDYGYDKFKVITNSFKIFFLFLFINLFIYQKLKGVYFPDKFRELDQRLTDWAEELPVGKRPLFFVARIPGIIVYTSYLFWGLKLDLKDIELRKPLFFCVLILEYSLGLVCIGYIANYIISK